MDNNKIKIDKSVACLTLGAIGDAFGAPVEFMTRQEINVKYGRDGIQGLDVAYGRLGAVTDDTQMTLFLADSLIAAFKRGSERGILAEYWTYSVFGYERWLSTQGEHNDNYTDSWWDPNPELFSIIKGQGRRGPGITCLGALKSMSKPSEPARNDSKGCGTVMRVAPIGIFFGNIIDVNKDDDLRKIYIEGRNDAAITHGHAVAQDASGTLVIIYALLLNGFGLSDSVEKALEFSQTQEVLTLCKQARDGAKNEPGLEDIKSLGRGWVAEEALAIALYCALLVEQDIITAEEAIKLSVNHDGDSDSTGAITGSIVGLMKGSESVPTHLLVEGSEVASLQNLFSRYGQELIEVTG